MIRVPVNQMRDELSRYLQLAKSEDVIITRRGVPTGILIGLENPDDWWEELLLRDPHFVERVEQARQSLKDGIGITVESLREKYSIGSGDSHSDEQV